MLHLYLPESIVVHACCSENHGIDFFPYMEVATLTLLMLQAYREASLTRREINGYLNRNKSAAAALGIVNYTINKYWTIVYRQR